MLDDSTWRKIDLIIANIYSSKNDKELRTVFLQEIKKIIPYDAASFDLKTKYKNYEIFSNPISVNYSNESMKDYYKNYADKDYANWLVTQSDLYSVYRDSDFISDEVIESSILYKKWLKPLGLKYGLGAIVSKDNNVFGSITFTKKQKKKDFSDKDIEILKILIKHISIKFSQLYPNGIIYKKGVNYINKYNLTKREDEICQLIYQGLNNSEIASTLCVSKTTVDRHIANIYSKVGVNNRIQLFKKVT